MTTTIELPELVQRRIAACKAAREILAARTVLGPTGAVDLYDTIVLAKYLLTGEYEAG
jgi:hypothetical protein